MFDTGAVWEGDWHHIIAVASFDVEYKKMTETDSTLWEWQTTKNYADGLQYEQFYMLGYSMPCAVSLAGATATVTGYFDGNDYDEFNKTYNGTFATVELCPLIQLTLSKSDTVMMTGSFYSRRSFVEEHDSYDEEPFLTQCGREWYFRRIAARWTHTY